VYVTDTKDIQIHIRIFQDFRSRTFKKPMKHRKLQNGLRDIFGVCYIHIMLSADKWALGWSQKMAQRDNNSSGS
jgi:hypothetical protein